MKFDNKVSPRVNNYNVLHGINTSACRPNLPYAWAKELQLTSSFKF